MGECQTFTLNLSPILVDTLYSPSVDTFMTRIRERVKGILKRALGRRVSLWFTLEATRPASRLHLHGSIDLAAHELPRAKAALVTAGQFTKPMFRRYAAHTAAAYDGDGWAAYSSKDLERTGKHVTGLVITCTNEVKRAAKEIYEAERAMAKAGW